MTTKHQHEGVWHFVAAVLFAIGYYYLLSPGAKHYIPEALRERLVEAVIVFVLAYAFVKSRSVEGAVDSARSGIADLTQRIIEDERIIFLRSSPHPHTPHTSRDIQVVGVEHPGPVPGQLAKPLSGDGQWGVSVSILRFDRMQDLLFSGPYIDHFVKLSRAATRSARILIVNDEPRCRSAVSAFLYLSEGLDIATYIYTKREYYAMLDAVRRATWRNKFKLLTQTLQGNPDLSVAVETFDAFVPGLVSPTGAIAKESDFLIRFMDENREIQILNPRNANGAVVGPLAAVMALAMHEPRRGSGVFESIFDSSAGRPGNGWTSKYIVHALQPFTKKVST